MTRPLDHTALSAAEPIAASCLVERATLLAALETINRIVERRNTIPVLSNVMLSPSDSGGLRLYATDLDLQCELDIEADWGAPGAFTVAAAALRDMVKKAPAGSQISLSADDGRLTISAGRMRSTLATLPVDDFPIIAFPLEGLSTFDLPSDQLARDLAALAPAMSNEETRHYLCGVAVQATEIDGAPCLAMISTDGGQMVRLARPVPAGAEAIADAIIPRKAIVELLRMLKKREPAALAVEIGGERGRLRVSGPGFRLTSKLVDGIYPNWRTAYDKAVGDVELQGVAMPELHPRLKAPQIAALAKAAGTALAVETGEFAAVLTSADFPEYLGVTMFLKEDEAPKGFGFNEYEHARAHAERYAAALAQAAGMPDLECAGVRTTDGLVVAVTFGRGEYVTPEPVEIVCYETFTTRVEYPESFTQYEDGAYSIPIPRSHGSLVAVEVAGDGGEVQKYPIRTKANGAIELTDAAVAALAGDPAEFERVEIAPLQFLHGEIVTGYSFPAVPCIANGKKSGKRFRPMTDREQIAAYCADPVGFMAQIRARSPDDREAAYQEEHARMVASVGDAQPEESNVVNGDFPAAQAERAPPVDEPAPIPVPDDAPAPIQHPADLPQEAAPAVEAPAVQPDAYAALEARLAVLEGIISAQGLAPAGEISRTAEPRPDPAPIEDGERAELETIIAALRADNAAQAATIERLTRNRSHLGQRLGQRAGQLGHERSVNAQLLGQIATFLRRRPDPVQVPVVYRPEPDAGPPDPGMVIGFPAPAAAPIVSIAA